MEFIRPLVEERFAKMEEFGEDWDDKPVRLSTSLNVNVIVNAELQNDLLMWLMSEAKGVERTLERLARRMLLVNQFAAIRYNVSCEPHRFFMKPLIASICRRLQMHCTIFFPTRNILNPSATTSRQR
jgi:hypothetical protein